MILDAKKIPAKEIAEKAAECLKEGRLIVFPTETCYGLGADATNEKAVKKIAKIKEQPEQKEISVIVSSLNQIEKYAELDNNAKKIAEKFFPSPLTLVVAKKKNRLNWLAKGTIAFRIPSNEIALGICRMLGKPVTATSANIHGKKEIYDSEEAIKYFSGKVDLIIDAGKLKEEKPSTLFDVQNKKVLREGKITEKEILEVIAE